MLLLTSSPKALTSEQARAGDSGFSHFLFYSLQVGGKGRALIRMWGGGSGEELCVVDCNWRANPMDLVSKVKVRGFLLNDLQLVPGVIPS